MRELDVPLGIAAPHTRCDYRLYAAMEMGRRTQPRTRVSAFMVAMFYYVALSGILSSPPACGTTIRHHHRTRYLSRWRCRAVSLTFCVDMTCYRTAPPYRQHRNTSTPFLGAPARAFYHHHASPATGALFQARLPATPAGDFSTTWLTASVRLPYFTHCLLRRTTDASPHHWVTLRLPFP